MTGDGPLVTRIFAVDLRSGRRLGGMPRLYGDRVSDAESALLIEKLRLRGSSGSLIAANTVGKGPSRDATAETSNQAREAILLELQEWVDLDKTAPDLAVLRDHLSAPQQGKRIIWRAGGDDGRHLAPPRRWLPLRRRALRGDRAPTLRRGIATARAARGGPAAALRHRPRSCRARCSSDRARTSSASTSRRTATGRRSARPVARPCGRSIRSRRHPRACGSAPSTTTPVCGRPTGRSPPTPPPGSRSRTTAADGKPTKSRSRTTSRSFSFRAGRVCSFPLAGTPVSNNQFIKT